MMNSRRFWLNLILTVLSGILLRWVAVSFNAYITGKLGEEGTGLLTLTMSVYGLAVTFATSGVNLASVRLTAERLAVLCEQGGTRKEFKRHSNRIMRSCLAYSLLFSLTTGTLLYFTAPFVSHKFLGDVRCTLSLRVLALSLPAISVSSALSGYFTGVRKVYKNVVTSLLEQAFKIILTAMLFLLTVPSGMDSVEYACLAVVGGAAVAEGFSLVINLILYFTGFGSDGCNSLRGKMLYGEKTNFSSVAGIALPVATGAYVRQGFSTTEHLSIPYGLKKSGMGGDGALAVYGVLQGMVFPLILFPSAVITSAAGLLVPEFARLKTLGQNRKINTLIKKVFSVSITYSIGCAAIMFTFADYFGISVYNNASAAGYIRITSLLIPVMYFDMTVDSILKGIGEQVYSMKVNIADSVLSLILSLCLIPQLGIKGYIVSVYVCECMNCLLSLLRLRKVTGVGLDVIRQIVPPASVAAVTAFFMSFTEGAGTRNGIEIIRIVLLAGIYLCTCITIDTLGIKVSGKKNKFPNTVEINCAGEYNI